MRVDKNINALILCAIIESLRADGYEVTEIKEVKKIAGGGEF